MTPAEDVDECVERLLEGFHHYDRCVDVVSAFEMLLTDSRTQVPATVAHFERFPRIAQQGGSPLTPDFSVMFADGGALVAEIASIALRDESVDSLCRQVMNYDGIEQVHGVTGMVEPAFVDVLLLVPQSVGVNAVTRIIDERLSNEGHFFKPSCAPCIVQFGFDQDRYTFQRLLAAGNGVLREPGRPDGLGAWFAVGNVNLKPDTFIDIKSQRAFVNDAMSPLYLAVHLWAKTFSAMAAGAPAPVRLDVTAREIAAGLRAQGGGVRARDVQRALELLGTARLAERAPSGWVVAWEELRTRDTKDLARTLATRACRPPSRGVADRLREGERAAARARDRPPTLFDQL